MGTDKEDEPHDRQDRVAPPTNYFVLSTEYEEWFVSREMAKAIELELDRTPRPTWIIFVDLSGARVRLRTRLVETVRQCTAEQRAIRRAIRRARDAEANSEPGWDPQS